MSIRWKITVLNKVNAKRFIDSIWRYDIINHISVTSFDDINRLAVRIYREIEVGYDDYKDNKQIKKRRIM